MASEKTRAYYREWYAKNKEKVLAQREARLDSMPQREVDSLCGEGKQRDALQQYIEQLAIPYPKKCYLVRLITMYTSEALHEFKA